VGGLLARNRVKAALAEAMKVVGEVNAYVSRTEPFKLKGVDERERLATVLHTLLQCVSDLNTILAPFLPHAANRVDAVIGGTGDFMPMPRVDVVAGLDTGDADRHYEVVTGDYRHTPRWESRPITPGTPITKPAPVFTKLDDSVVATELSRSAGL
jgi:methionyl-tRNA synthetase